MSDISAFKFLGLAIPGGIKSETKEITDWHGDNMIFSLSFSINKLCKNLIVEDSDSPEIIQQKYSDFYNVLQDLKNISDKPNSNLCIYINGNDKPLPPGLFKLHGISLQGEESEHKSLKDFLWEKLFPVNKGPVNNQSRLKNYPKIPSISSLTEGLEHHFDSFDTNNKFHNKKIHALVDKSNGMLPGIDLKNTLSKIYEYGKINNDIAEKDKLAYYKRHFEKIKNGSLTGELREEEFLSWRKQMMQHYLSSEIDIDEVLHNFNIISSNYVLSRIMGLTIDFCSLDGALNDVIHDIKSGGTFNISFGLCNNPNAAPDYSFSETSITSVIRKDKCGLLVNHGDKSSKYYYNSILRSDDSQLIRFDEVAKASSLIQYSEKILQSNSQSEDANDNNDALTRGILYTNKNLKDIIAPIDIDMHIPLTDDFLVQGHRVAVMVYNSYENRSKGKMHSLTSRKTTMFYKNNQIYESSKTNTEGCVHFDSPTQYLKDGTVENVTNDILFEYSGELLTLKSAFSRASKIKESEKEVYALQHHHDDGLFKSIARFGNGEEYSSDNPNPTPIISFDYFPFNIEQKKGTIDMRFDIPDRFTESYSPKLRFNNCYEFAVYQEYSNGWGLPLYKQANLQLSVDDLIDTDGSIWTDPIEFQPLENKKAPHLFHRKPVSKDMVVSITEKPSLENFVVRSQSVDDIVTVADERHILPPKIELEQGFWYGLLSAMSPNYAKSGN